MDIKQYRKVNESFRRRLIFHVGIDSGLFVELNYLINAILYGLAHQIRIELYSEDANFGTGTGWTEYFAPFCEEVHEPFHRRYNFHRPPSWKRIIQKKSLRFVAWKLKTIGKNLIGRWLAYRVYGGYVLLTQNIPANPDKHYCVPALAIDSDYTEAYGMVARMIWRFQPMVGAQAVKFRHALHLPPVYAAAQIRGGDKQTEATLIDGKIILQQFNLPMGNWVFVLTDDYRLLEKARADFPKLHIVSLCQPTERGYVHQEFCKTTPWQKREAITRLLVSVDLILRSRSFVGSVTTGPSVFVLKIRANDPLVKAIDCPPHLLKETLPLTIDRRAAISKEAILQCHKK